MNTIDKIGLKGKRVLLRVDLNCPLDKTGKVADDTRIRAVLPSIRHCLNAGARLILCSHLGRPKGEKRPEFSLAPVAKRLSEILSQEVVLAPDCIGPEVNALIDGLEEGRCLLLENVRFYKEETKNDTSFAKSLASCCDIFVNDAFAACHREHASVVGLPRFSRECAIGFLLKKELDYFERAVSSPVRPMVAIMGGAKVSSKLSAIKNILKTVDKIIIGGAMANTFLKAKGIGVGSSLVEDDLIDEARSIMKMAEERSIPFYLPVDAVIAQDIEDNVTMIRPYGEIPDRWKAFDIGPASVLLFKEAIQDARTIVWNGPVGAFEKGQFSRGTFAMSSAIAALHALTIVGGGDTDRAVHEAGDADSVSYMSTGGGAFLHLMEGKELPGVIALKHCGEEESN